MYIFVSSQQKTESHFLLPFITIYTYVLTYYLHFNKLFRIEIQIQRFEDWRMDNTFFYIFRQRKVKTIRQTLKVNVSSIRFCAETWKNSSWLISFEAFHLYNNTNSIDSICRIAFYTNTKAPIPFPPSKIFELYL